jgi:hypothetical protein
VIFARSRRAAQAVLKPVAHHPVPALSTAQHIERLSIQRYVPRLLVLCRRSLDGELLALRVDRRPAESQEFAAANSGVHGGQHRGREMVTVVQ